MSHTNSTTNYNLPQFVGSDKPAWLGDINPAMSTIDTAIKNVSDSATSASTASVANTTAIGDLTELTTTDKSNLVDAVNEIDAEVGTTNTQVGLNTTAIGQLNSALNDVNTNLNKVVAKFNINDFTTGSGNFTGFTLAQNNDGSLFKFYGFLQVGGASAVTISGITAVPGLNGTYGYDTGLVLNTAPSTAYIVKTSGFRYDNDTTNGRSWNAQPQVLDFAVGTDGHIYVYCRTSQSNVGSTANYYMRWWYPPMLMFNGNFGDDITPVD